MRADWDTYFMDLAFKAADRSTCTRRMVGGVLVKDKRVKATAYNGSLPGDDHCTDVGCAIGSDGRCKRTIHMERNLFSDASWTERASSTVYCTDTPCLDCAHLVCRSGVVEWVYVREYKHQLDRVMDVLHYHGIVIRKLDGYRVEEPA